MQHLISIYDTDLTTLVYKSAKWNCFFIISKCHHYDHFSLQQKKKLLKLFKNMESLAPNGINSKKKKVSMGV